MLDRFRQLEPERQERIIRASMHEFAVQGYDKASTNVIVEEAGISKGLLFHYFGSKKNLFLFIYDYAAQTVLNNLQQKIDLQQRDILARWRQVALLKIELIAQYPELFDFLMSATFSDVDPSVLSLQTANRKYAESFYQRFFADVDYSLFRAGVDIPRAMEVIGWTIEGFSNKLAEEIKSLSLAQIDYEAIMHELDLTYSYCDSASISNQQRSRKGGRFTKPEGGRSDVSGKRFEVSLPRGEKRYHQEHLVSVLTRRSSAFSSPSGAEIHHAEDPDQDPGELWGEILYCGKDLRTCGREFFDDIGVGFEVPVLFSKLTALENLDFYGRLYQRQTDVEALMQRVGLWQDRHKRVGEYSKGMKVRLNFVRAMLNDPQVLFLDEPTSGLDPQNARIIKDIILEFQRAGGLCSDHTSDARCRRTVRSGGIFAGRDPRDRF